MVKAKSKPVEIEIFDCEQNSDEWYAARLGLATASEFSTVLAKGKDGTSGNSKTRKTYMLKLADEIVSGERMESYTNPDMERGKEMEDEARLAYAFMHDADCERVGFIKHSGFRAGCSPDSLIGSKGLLEVKTKLPHLLYECLLREAFPPEHYAQCQGSLWVSGREWIDIAIYWPRRKLVVRRAYRDDKYIAGLAHAVSIFNEELDQIVERIRSEGDPDTLKSNLQSSLEMARPT